MCDLKRLVNGEDRLGAAKIRKDLNTNLPKPISRETVRSYVKNLSYEYAVKIKKTLAKCQASKGSCQLVQTTWALDYS